MDLGMPLKDGFEASAEIFEICDNLCIKEKRDGFIYSK